MSTLVLRNRQKTRAVDLRFLRRLTVHLLQTLLEEPVYELAIHLVGSREMARLNEQFLQHTGSTDIITFDYKDEPPAAGLSGELFISLDDALAQAGEFKTTWQEELARYVVHGLLHLQGFDDLKPDLRREMKREENKQLRHLAREFPLSKLARPSRLKA